VREVRVALSAWYVEANSTLNALYLGHVVPGVCVTLACAAGWLYLGHSDRWLPEIVIDGYRK
jgi:hypothetical protein